MAKTKTKVKEPLTLKLHSQVWLLNEAGGEHGPYFVVEDLGEEVVVMRHYVSETPGGKFSQWSAPLRIGRDYCILKDEKMPRLHCFSGWDWFLGELHSPSCGIVDQSPRLD